jgi:hypothetical protein
MVSIRLLKCFRGSIAPVISMGSADSEDLAWSGNRNTDPGSSDLREISLETEVGLRGSPGGHAGHGLHADRGKSMGKQRTHVLHPSPTSPMARFPINPPYFRPRFPFARPILPANAFLAVNPVPPHHHVAPTRRPFHCYLLDRPYDGREPTVPPQHCHR